VGAEEAVEVDTGKLHQEASIDWMIHRHGQTNVEKEKERERERET